MTITRRRLLAAGFGALAFGPSAPGQEIERILGQTAKRENDAGFDLWNQGRYAEAAARFQTAAETARALRIARRDRLRAAVAQGAGSNGRADLLAFAVQQGALCDELEWLGEEEELRGALESLAASWARLADRKAEASAWERAARSWARSGKQSMAFAALDRAAPLGEPWKSPAVRAAILETLGNLREAQPLWNESAAMLAALPEPATPTEAIQRFGWELDARLNAASAALAEGRIRVALDARNKLADLTFRMHTEAPSEKDIALRELLEMACNSGEVRKLAFEASLEEHGGNQDQALKLYQAALGKGPVLQSGAAANIRVALSRLYSARGNWQAARAEAAEAVRLRTGGPEFARLDALLAAARVEIDSGADQTALLMAIRESAIRVGLRVIQARASLLLAKATGSGVDGLSMAGQARELFRSAGMRPGEIEALAIAGERQEKAGNLELAVQSYRHALEIAEVLLRDLTAAERQQFGPLAASGEVTRIQERLVGLLLRMGDRPQALRAADWAARYSLAQASGGAPRKGGAEAGSRREFARRIRDLRSREPDAVFTIEPLNLIRFQQRLAPNETAILYHPGNQRLAIFAVTRTALEAVETPFTQAQLRQAVETVRSAASAYRDKLGAQTDPPPQALEPDLQAALRLLYRQLVVPVAAMCGAGRRILIVPQGDLFYLPFAALANPESGKFWIEEVSSLAYVTACDLIPASSGVAASGSGGGEGAGRMVAFGNPPGAALPEAEREVAGLKARFPGRSRIYVGSQATKRALLAERSARYLHFATHGIVDERDPAASYLMLGGGNLTIEDTYDLPIRNAELAVLSACRTALGHSSQAGTEVGVFVEAFRHVARNVVATMWPVDDLGTRWFMDGFYSRIVQGEPPAAALAGAQRNLIRKPGLRHPFFWAPFVAYGHS